MCIEIGRSLKSKSKADQWIDIKNKLFKQKSYGNISWKCPINRQGQ